MQRAALLRVFAERLRRDGVGQALRLAGGRLGSVVRSIVEDRRRGIATASEVNDLQLGFADPQNHAYVATDYDVFHKAMRSIRIRAGEDVFVDFGSGKGRPVLLAAEYPFRRVIGVEFARQLHDIACENLRASNKRVCPNVEFIHADATAWPIPGDATVLFFFNPFEGDVLVRVFDAIRRSLEEHPRDVTIIYVRADKFFERQVNWSDWLLKRDEFPCSDGKVAIYQNIAAG